MKRDGYNFEERWSVWKNRNKLAQGISKNNFKLLLKFLSDMELGLNTPVGRKGKREAGTLLNLASHNVLFLKLIKKDLLKLTKEDLHKLEKNVCDGVILRKDAQKYTAFGNYIKDFKAFYHWLLRTGRVKTDITADLSSATDKPAWVYLTEAEAKTFFNKMSYYYRVICWFMYDSGSRVTEANSIQIKHFSKDFKQVTIPEEASKTFERTINLKLCSNLIKDFVETNNLTDEDFLFSKDLFATNKYLKYNCGKLFGPEKVSNSKAKGKYGQFTLYDIRHNSACYWLNRYPTQTALMYRMGWKSADKVDYYTNFLGLSDKIQDTDMIVTEDKNQYVSKIENLEKQITSLKEDFAKVIVLVQKQHKEKLIVMD